MGWGNIFNQAQPCHSKRSEESLTTHIQKPVTVSRPRRGNDNFTAFFPCPTLLFSTVNNSLYIANFGHKYSTLLGMIFFSIHLPDAAHQAINIFPLRGIRLFAFF
jgi:hypothetical protein